jgi:dephospho-CoA kinase
VYSSYEINIKRLRDKAVPEAEAKRRLDSQLPVNLKIRGADFVIDNSGSLEDTREQVRSVYQDLLAAEKRNANN